MKNAGLVLGGGRGYKITPTMLVGAVFSIAAITWMLAKTTQPQLQRGL